MSGFFFCVLSAAFAENVAEPQGPEDIVLPYTDNADDLWEADREVLLGYAREADTVVVGQVVSTRSDWLGFGLTEIVSVYVEERIRGDAVGLVEMRSPFVASEDELPHAAIIEGYRLLVFLDASGNILDGRAVFLVEGENAWRSRREGVFMRPSVDRVWSSEMDPTTDYMMVSLQEVRFLSARERHRRRR